MRHLIHKSPTFSPIIKCVIHKLIIFSLQLKVVTDNISNVDCGTLASARHESILSAKVYGKPSASLLPFTLRTPQRPVLYAVHFAAFPDITISGFPASW